MRKVGKNRGREKDGGVKEVKEEWDGGRKMRRGRGVQSKTMAA